MKIAMFSWEALEGLSVGGGAVYASRLAAALARAGHRVRLFTRAGRGQAMEENVQGVMVRRCPWDSRPTFLEEIDALSHSFSHYFAESVKAEGPYDVIHCHEWFTIAAGLRAFDIAPARLAVSFHSTEWGRTGVWPDQGDSARISRIEEEGIRRADAVVAASYWARRIIHEQFHPPDWKCQVVYHGADLTAMGPEHPAVQAIRQAAGLGPDSPAALFAGRFSQPGGGDLAARAARIVAERFPDGKFIFVGSGPLEDDMRREAGAAGIFLPPQGRVVPDELYGAVNLVLAPFRRDHNGRAVLPAWSGGKPVITLRNTVPSEFIVPGANGWVVGPDPVELASAIIEAFQAPDYADWLGRNGRVAAETAFSWDESAKRLLEAYTRRDRLSPSAAME